MTQNPFLNALAAAGYIVVVVCLFQLAAFVFPQDPNPVFAMLMFLSVFVFSVAVMGYTLILAPFKLLLEGQHGPAATFFLKTMAAFAAICIVLGSIALFLPIPSY